MCVFCVSFQQKVCVCVCVCAHARVCVGGFYCMGGEVVQNLKKGGVGNIGASS